MYCDYIHPPLSHPFPLPLILFFATNPLLSPQPCFPFSPTPGGVSESGTCRRRKAACLFPNYLAMK